MTAAANGSRPRQRIFSVYLDRTEDQVLRELAFANGLSVNGVIRNLCRLQLGLPAPELRIPDRVQATIAERQHR